MCDNNKVDNRMDLDETTDVNVFEWLVSDWLSLLSDGVESCWRLHVRSKLLCVCVCVCVWGGGVLRLDWFSISSRPPPPLPLPLCPLSFLTFNTLWLWDLDAEKNSHVQVRFHLESRRQILCLLLYHFKRLVLNLLQLIPNPNPGILHFGSSSLPLGWEAAEEVMNHKRIKATIKHKDIKTKKSLINVLI